MTKLSPQDLQTLSEEQVAQYWDDGFIVVPDILDADYMHRMRHRAREIALNDPPPGCERLITKDIRVVRGEYTPDDPELGIWKYMHADRIDPLFAQFAETPRVLDVAQDLIGLDIMAASTMFIYKPPGVESEHHLHQDGEYMRIRPYDRILGVWAPLDHATAENGTMRVIPGSHKGGLRQHARPEGDFVNAGILTARRDDTDPPEVTFDIEPGSALFFHPLLLHGTGPNRTRGHRRVITIHLVSARCTYAEDQNIRFGFQSYQFRLVRGTAHAGCIGGKVK